MELHVPGIAIDSADKAVWYAPMSSILRNSGLIVGDFMHLKHGSDPYLPVVAPQGTCPPE